MDPTHTPASSRRKNTFLNVAVAANAVLLGLLLVGPNGLAPHAIDSVAQAAPPVNEDGDPTGRVNPAEQRKQIISELQSMNQRMATLESTLKKGISVKVTEMPKQDTGEHK